jgi:hypothetical protein
MMLVMSSVNAGDDIGSSIDEYIEDKLFLYYSQSFPLVKNIINRSSHTDTSTNKDRQ